MTEIEVKSTKEALEAYHALDKGLVCEGVIIEKNVEGDYMDYIVMTVYGFHKIPLTPIHNSAYVLNTQLYHGRTVSVVITDCDNIFDIKVAFLVNLV